MPDKSDTVKNLAKARSLAYEVAQRHDIEGGVCIFHPWRKGDDPHEYVPDGYWHFHIVGVNFGNIPMGGDDFTDDGALIVFKHIVDDETGDYGGLRSGLAVARLLQYLLTHAGLTKGAHALTYFGCLSYNQLPAGRVHESYPECLDDDSITNLGPPKVCPACGSTAVELGAYNSYCGREGPLHIEAHPEPDYAPSPGAIAEAERAIEEDFEYRYQLEPDPVERHKLTKERQRARADLARRECELFNVRNPLVAVWMILHDVLTKGVDYLSIDPSKPFRMIKKWVPRDELLELVKCEPLAGIPYPVLTVIAWNLQTGRLAETPSGLIGLARSYELADALADVALIIKSGEPKNGIDWRLEHLLEANPSPENAILSDTGFVFGGHVNLAIRQAGGVPE